MRGSVCFTVAVAVVISGLALQTSALVAFVSGTHRASPLRKIHDTFALHATAEQTDRENAGAVMQNDETSACITPNESNVQNVRGESTQIEGQLTEEQMQQSDDVCDDEGNIHRNVIAARFFHKLSSPTSRSRGASVSESQEKRDSTKNTSVGARREGSATRVRNSGNGLRSTLLSSIKSSAIAAAAVAAKNKSLSVQDEKSEDSNRNALSVKRSTIESVIDSELSNLGLLGSRTPNKTLSDPEGNVSGDVVSHHDVSTLKPSPGSVLIESAGRTISMQLKDRIRDHTLVRVATKNDDLEIAKLRLSVFSDFSPEISHQFRTKSCEALRNRRLKGATCLIASVNYREAGLQFDLDEESCPYNWIVGSAECSFHEFAGTQLGLRRPAGSIIYVTEVAVAPKARRTGTGTKLLKAVDRLAKIRNIETVYLHVDVENTPALKLYKKNGYEVLDSKDPIYNEFTTRLNLHDGATKGRNHFLLHKKITKHQTWLEPHFRSNQTQTRGILGFDVPDLFD